MFLLSERLVSSRIPKPETRAGGGALKSSPEILESCDSVIPHPESERSGGGALWRGGADADPRRSPRP